MTLYEINDSIQQLIDPETGEILDFEAFQDLQLAMTDKMENIALWIKDLAAEENALGAEISALTERKRATKNKIERLKDYLAKFLSDSGGKFSTPKVALSFRKSLKVNVTPDFLEWAEKEGEVYLRYKAPEIDLTEVKKALQSGVPLPFAELEERQNLQIK